MLPMSTRDTMPVYADINGSLIAKVTIVLNSALTISALLLLQQDVPLFWESFTKEFQRDVLKQNNYTDPLTIRHVLEFSAPSSPHFEIVRTDNKHMLIEYGTTWFNWCWNDPLPLSGLPSILRAIEFHSISQLLLRFTFLWSLSVRPILGALRALAVYNRLSLERATIKPTLTSSRTSLSSKALLSVPRRVTLLNRAILSISPPVSFLVLIPGYFITAWQQDIDYHSVMWVPFYAFAALYTLHMLLYTAIELMEPDRMNFLRVLARFALTSLFTITAMTVLKTQDEFLQRKTCHIIVPIPAAIDEYLCCFSITAFSLLEWTDVWHLNIMAQDNGIDTRVVDECCSSSISSA
ncbi:hypothetical protein PENTCL1PPCAC_14477 [Pristionchus entomophagus]|uniref:G protein-coupled receptor n=1 Tax=Pristionchus entomophagus TaxID=358040 RepID=A0AAV5TBJ9_9BILA|nr:hypothetical protein PENTCL1PPCAC_14477 [Pristionchus entomophagus]